MEGAPLLTPEILVPRLGDYLVEKGYLSENDLQTAIKRQQSLRQNGQIVLLGQVLTELGLIAKPQLDRAITEQIVQLRSALQSANQHLEERVKQRTAELEQTLQKLSESNQIKANIISNISHELRTPLTHIKGYLEILIAEDMGPVPPDQMHILSIMQHSADRLERLIDDLIQYSIAEKSQVNLELQKVDLGRICTAVLATVKSKIEERELRASCRLTSDLPMVRADEEKISWVISQLVDNAIKFTSPGGEILISLESDGKVVTCSIKDSGIGIPANRQNEVFEPFHQLDSSSTRRYGGTGLGLALVKKIIEAHSASIQLVSTEGSGSIFSFQLPAVT
jgi:two-component system sensor histidine kinase/response regulator